MVHVAVNSRRHRTELCCAAHTAWPSGLCWAAQIPWPQINLSQLIVTEPALEHAHCNMLRADQRPVRCCTTRGSQHLRGRKIICAVLSFFIGSALRNDISDDTLQNLNVFLTGIIANQHLRPGAKHLAQAAGPSEKYFSGKWILRKTQPESLAGPAHSRGTQSQETWPRWFSR